MPGVGPKPATDLLKRFGSIDAILSRLMEIKSDKLRADLLGASENLRRNQLLIGLHLSLAGGPSLAELTPRPPELPKLREMYKRWGFRSLLSEIT